MTSSYRIEEEALSRDRSRLDARELRLRLWHDDAYHQFFTVAVPGIDFRDFPDGGPAAGGFWNSIRRQAVQAIEEWVEEGGQPLRDPTVAVELPVNFERARKAARKNPAPWVDGNVRRIIGRFDR